MPVVMTRPPFSDRTPVLLRGAALAALMLACAWAPTAMAQNGTDLPGRPGVPQQRAPLPVPKTPDIEPGPLPASPDQTGIPPAPLSDLPPPRIGTAAATLAPVPARVTGGSLSLTYQPQAEQVPANTDPLIADIVSRLTARPNERLEIKAHATGPADRANDARRTALVRARLLRDRLVTAGVDPLRLIIFAQGTPVPAVGTASAPAPEAPSPDRVDLVFRT